MYDDVAGLRVTLDGDGFDRFETVADRDESGVRRSLSETAGVEAAFSLETCQRYELYAYGPDARDALAELGRSLALDVAPDSDHLVTGRSAVEHLFRVACGLESGVLGEDEILGQLRRAHTSAVDAGTLDGHLETIVSKALRVGERARTETSINEGTVSLGSVALERIREALDDPGTPDSLRGCETIVVGAGEMATLVVDAIACRVGPDASVTVANRSAEGAERLADRVDGTAIPLSALSNDQLAAADVVVSATAAPDRVLTMGDLVGHELVVVDMANPRDVDPAVGDLADVSLASIDDVLAVQNDELRRREAAVEPVRRIIDEELERLTERLRIERVDDALERFYSQAYEIRESELQQAFDRLEANGEPLTDAHREAIRDCSEAIVNKLLHPKAATLRRAAANDDSDTVDAWLQLFGQASDDGTRADG